MNFLFRFLLLLSIPAAAFPMQAEQLPPISISIDTFLRSQIDPLLLNYDEVLDWIDAIESDELDEKYSPSQVEKIALFLSFLAWNGASSNNSLSSIIVQQDIETLLCDNHNIQHLPHEYSNSCSIQSALFCTSPHTIFCKSWMKKQGHGLKKFVKKHKTAIIIGAAIVVAVVAVIAVAAVTSTTAVAAAISGAAAELAQEEQTDLLQSLPFQTHEQQIAESSVDPIETAEQIIPALTTTILAQTIEDKLAPIRESLTLDAAMEEISSTDSSHTLTLAEKARELGACATHQLLDGLAALGSTAPELMAEIGEVSSRLFPHKSLPPDHSNELFNPIGHYNEVVQLLHEKIDVVFSTNQAMLYTEEAKESLPNFTIGALPPPGMIGAFKGDLKQLADAGKAFDRAGFTRAGRGLMKHGDRPNGVFSKTKGTPAQINAQGQEVLEKILNHPQKVISFKTSERYGEYMDIKTPDLGGARFSADGKQFIGFLEP